MPLRSQNQFEPYLEQIRALAEQGRHTAEILQALGMEVTKGNKEQLRRFLHSRKLPIAKQGAQRGEKHRDWKGGRIIHRSGYVLIYKPDHPHARRSGYILEHRFVMEQQIGRLLLPTEAVHHINGDKQDNRPENLELFESNAEHLAETLKGQVPKWSAAGRKRTVDGVKRSHQRYVRRRNRKGQFSGGKATPKSKPSETDEA